MSVLAIIAYTFGLTRLGDWCIQRVRPRWLPMTDGEFAMLLEAERRQLVLEFTAEMWRLTGDIRYMRTDSEE